MSYRKIGGLHFIRIGRFGFTWYWSKPKPKHGMYIEHKRRAFGFDYVPGYDPPEPDDFNRYVAGDR